jgi:GAF domain-containing protein
MLMTIQAVSDWESEIQQRRTLLLNSLLLATVVGGLIALISVYVSLPTGTSAQERWAGMSPFFAAWLVTLVALLWRGLGYRVRTLILLIVTYVLSTILFVQNGLAGSWGAWMLLPAAMTFVLLGARQGIWAGAISALLYVGLAFAISQGWITPHGAVDLTALGPLVSEGASFLFVAALLTLLWWSFSQGWLDTLLGANAANQQLQAQTHELEEKNEQLNRQTSQLQATAEIAKAGSSILDPEALLVEVVNRVEEGFKPLGVYYAGLFLLDETQRFARLKAATGEAGRLALEMGYQEEMDETSAVGWCIIHRQAHIVLSAAESTVRFGAVPMPETRSEIALPLRSRGRILGALSVHSTRRTAFEEADVAVLQTMADQVAVAIDNAQLFSQTEAVLAEVRTVQRHYLAQAWQDFLALSPVNQVDYTQPGVEVGDHRFLRKARHRAVKDGQTVSVNSADDLATVSSADSGQTAMVVPLKLREQVIGTMSLLETRHQRLWTSEEIAMTETVAEQVALTIENLRLMDETQRRAVRERLVSEISDRMQRATDMADLMRISAEGLNEALNGSRTLVRMGTKDELIGGNGNAERSGE